MANRVFSELANAKATHQLACWRRFRVQPMVGTLLPVGGLDLERLSFGYVGRCAFKLRAGVDLSLGRCRHGAVGGRRVGGW